MENLKFPESWEQPKKEAAESFGIPESILDLGSGAASLAIKNMAEAYEARIAELESIISENRYRFEVIDTTMTRYLKRIQELETVNNDLSRTGNENVSTILSQMARIEELESAIKEIAKYARDDEGMELQTNQAIINAYNLTK